MGHRAWRKKSEIRRQRSEIRRQLGTRQKTKDRGQRFYCGSGFQPRSYDLNGFYDFNGFYDLPLIAHHFRRSIFIIRPKNAVKITKAAMSPMGTATRTLNFKTNMSRGTKMNRISPMTMSARHPVKKSLLNSCPTGFSSISLLNSCSAGFSSISFIVPIP